MDYRKLVGILRLSTAALLIGVLGACATTQRTSSGMGTIDNAAAASPSTASPTAAASASQVSSKPGPSDSDPGTPVQSAGQSAVNGTGNARSADDASGVAATTVSSEEIDAEKRALAEEKARIAKLDASQAQQPVADAATGTAPTPATNTTQTRRAAADEAQAVFPENNSTPAPDRSKASNQDNSDASKSASQQIAPKPLEHSVYFDFDKSLIKEQFDTVLKAQAAFLEAHKNFSAEIQGNCDERGSREYNLALGARRAEAVKQALELLGVDGEKIKTVSFGAEKPIALGKDEASYTQNRRVDIVD